MLFLSQIEAGEVPEDFGAVLYQDVANIHPLGLIAVLTLGSIMLTVPRRWALLPLFVMACVVSSVQKIVVFSLDFNLLRIMVLFAVLRLISRREYKRFVWRPCDTAVVLWVISGTVIFTLQQGSISALVFKAGTSFDTLGMYFGFRCLIREWRDIKCFLLGTIVTGVVVMIVFGLEHKTGRNMFSVFGGVPAITMVREGRLRCQGAFPHPITAGTFWAAMWPLYAARWWDGWKGRIWAVIGTAVVWFIVYACASSTPLLGLLGSFVGGVMFFLRRRMRMVRWGILISLVALHIVMKGPVWSLIARVGGVAGSTGWFRYKMVDSAIQHFGEWAILGTRSTAHWFYGAHDVCNQYVLQGVQGGVLTLGLYVVVIAYLFREAGYLWRAVRQDEAKVAIAWGLGVGLFAHCMIGIGGGFMGVAYLVPLFTFAAITTMASVERLRQPTPVTAAQAGLRAVNNSHSVPWSCG